MPVPLEDDIRSALYKAIEDLKEPGDETGGYEKPNLLPVEAEWTGYRSGATKNSGELRCSEAQKYKEMMKEVTSKTTVLYFHGGAYYLMDPATHRTTTKKLAKLTKGRCFSVRYRLAPQNPFPAALLDALVSYFTLLYPSPESFHEAIDPKHIVFAGDSAGGNLCLVLLQTILELRRQNVKIVWNGEKREVPIPAGVALSSPWMDLTASSPSCGKNGGFDYLPPMGTGVEERKQPPPCVAWPSNPPRRNLYAEDAVRHRLESHTSIMVDFLVYKKLIKSFRSCATLSCRHSPQSHGREVLLSILELEQNFSRMKTSVWPKRPLVMVLPSSSKNIRQCHIALLCYLMFYLHQGYFLQDGLTS